MKTKMKTKMKTILSVCVLSIFLYACSKNNPTPDPVLDCMDLLAVDGVAVLDDCGTCHQSYVYDLGPNSTHTPTYINDTTGLVLGATEILVLAGSDDYRDNPYTTWNGGPLAAMDTCGTCHQSYMYEGMGQLTYVVTYDDTVGVDGMFVLAGSPIDIASNPGWNTGCK